MSQANSAPDGKITSTFHDGLNRVAQMVQNLTGQAVTVATPPTFDPAHPDQNAPNSGATTYDIAGRVIRTTDATGLATEYGYDGLGRTVTVTVLPADGAPIVSRSLQAITVSSRLAFLLELRSGSLMEACIRFGGAVS